MSNDSTWAELPFDLQEQFYHIAENTAADLKNHIREVEQELVDSLTVLKQGVNPLEVVERQPLRIAAVDGSRSPAPAQRIGANFGVFSVGTVYMQGTEMKHTFSAATVDDSKTHSVGLDALLSMTQLKMEREAALAALPEVDLVLLDGSFYGFASEVLSTIRKRRSDFNVKRLGEWSQAVSSVLECTKKLENSGKCIGVIKRSRLRALSGWLSLREGKKILVNTIDKHISNRLLAANEELDYGRLVGENESVLEYSRLAYNIASGSESRTSREAFAIAKEQSRERFRAAFERPFSHSFDLLGLKRHHVRLHAGSQVCELEVPRSVPRQLLSRLLHPNEFAPATGLPFAIDIVDELVGIPRAFTRDFVHEVEARVVSGYPDHYAVKSFFAGLNPQKEGIE